MKLTQAQIEEHILMALSEWSPLSYWDYAEIAGIRHTSAHGRMSKLWDKGTLYIAEWRRGRSGTPTPLYAIGRITDAPRPTVLTPNEKVIRYRNSPKGQAKAKELMRKRNKQRQKLRQADPEWAAKERKYSREYARRKYGHKPQAARVAADIDLIAMQFGITWRFATTRSMAA